MRENDSVESHVGQINEMLEKLASIGEESLSKSWRVSMLLLSLPKSYDI